MLGRLALGLGCFNGLSRRSIGLRSVHLAPNSGRAETLIPQDERPVSPPAADPRWVMLSTYLRLRDGVAGNAKTAAEARTSTGRSFRVSADLAAPPATSSLCYDWEGGGQCSNELLAAHGDSVLIRNKHDHGRRTSTDNFFVYRAGTAARAPSLSRLPTRTTYLIHQTTGLLHRSEDELLVVELRDKPRGRRTADRDINVLRIGSSEWEKRSAVPIVLGDGSRGGMRWDFFPDRVVPVGDRFLCWVNYSSGGILLCDMAADPDLVLRHLPLPVTPWPRGGPYHIRGYSDDELEDDMMLCSRNMCGAGAAALRFVSVDPRCCCGGPGRSTCPHSTFAFTVTTWTMSLTTPAEGERMAWAVDGVLDCKELWAMPGYGDLPRVPPECPVVSPDNPDVVCFKVSKEREMAWMLEVDTRRKVLLSVVQCGPYDQYLAAKF